MKNTIFLLCVLSVLTPSVFVGQTSGSISGSVEAIYAHPVGTLDGWFKPTPGFRILVGQRSESDLLWQMVFERIEYKEGSEKLYFRDLSVRLSTIGAGFQLKYYPIGVSKIYQPFVLAGSTLYRWLAKRGAHATDTTLVLVIPEQSQQDWSFGFGAGIGMDLVLIPGLTASIDARYHILVAELWPALALRLENVSGIQTWQIALGLKYELE
jgi:hypothetical protein